MAIPGVDMPQPVASAEEAVQLSLEWEMEVTKQINELMALAVKENDFIAQQLLGWFVNEQLEEVSTMGELLSVVRRAGPTGLLFVEDYISRRPNPHAEGES